MTAAWVAAWRGWGRKLPAEARLVEDPWGNLFGGPAARWVQRVPGPLTVPVWPLALHMQVRTRAIDDLLASFLASGGRQVLILGAGYDCRAARFARELGDGTVFEVDHPATQARKREILDRFRLPGRPAVHLPWDFEERSVDALPDALAEHGHDPSRPTLTIWEGVTMYLQEPAIAATTGAVSRLSAPGSRFVLTYVDRASIARPRRVRRWVARTVAAVGEPFRFGWDPDAFPAWFAAYGFATDWDRELGDLANELLPPGYAAAVQIPGHRIAALTRRG